MPIGLPSNAGGFFSISQLGLRRGEQIGLSFIIGMECHGYCQKLRCHLAKVTCQFELRIADCSYVRFPIIVIQLLARYAANTNTPNAVIVGLKAQKDAWCIQGTSTCTLFLGTHDFGKVVICRVEISTELCIQRLFCKVQNHIDNPPYTP